MAARSYPGQRPEGDDRDLAEVFIGFARHLPGSLIERVKVELESQPAAMLLPPLPLDDFLSQIASVVTAHGVTRPDGHPPDVLGWKPAAFEARLVLRVSCGDWFGVSDTLAWPVTASVRADGVVGFEFDDLSTFGIQFNDHLTIADDTAVLHPGLVLTHDDRGPYVVGSRIGAGGTSVVHELWSRDGRLAAKCVLPGRFSLDELVPRFDREIRHLRDLAHPNVIRFIDALSVRDRAVLIMEMADESLADRLKHGRPPPDTALSWVEQALAGLSALHDDGLVHRDLSPKNFMFVGDQLKIADFGTVRADEDVDVTTDMKDARLGSLLYMADEQRRDPHSAVPASDVFAMGQVAYETFTGRRPFGNPPSLLASGQTTEAVAAVIDRMRAYAIEARYRDAGAALADLRRASQGS